MTHTPSPPNINQWLNTNVRQLSGYNAGLSVEALKKKYHVNRIAKLGSNENPFGTSESVKKILSEPENLAHYPDPNASELKARLAHQFNIPTSSLVIGNGSEDIIQMIARTCINTGDKVLTVVPSFGLHILYPQSCGAEMLIVPMTASLTFDIDQLVTTLIHQTPKLFFIASPSNPVGCHLSAADLQRLLDVLSPQTLLIFDEAYYEYAQAENDYPDVLTLLKQSGQPFVLLRTLSKAYSLAGLRIGYGICSPGELATAMDKVRTPFNVNRLAQKAAIAALNDQAHLGKTLDWNRSARAQMVQQLHQLGLNPSPSYGNFLFFSTAMHATVLAEKLLQQGVIIKPWMESGYEHYVRVSIGSADENTHFIQCLTQILPKNKPNSAQ